LKPDNILIDEAGHPFVTDFGLAKRVDPTSPSATISAATPVEAPAPEGPGAAGPARTPAAIEGTREEFSSGTETEGGSILGTPSYMPPEQARGQLKQVSTLSDVYGLGAVLYELLTGRPPFIGTGPFDIIAKVLDDPVQPPRELDRQVDRDLEAVCLKCLQKDPSSRYDSAEAFARDLARWREGRPVHARRAGRSERLARWVRREPWQAALAGLLLACQGLGAWFAGMAIRERESRQQALLAEARARTGEAEAARLKAEMGAAEDNFRRSNARIEELLRVVETELAADPALEPLRRRLLRFALGHFEDAARRWEGDHDRLADLAAAYGKMADYTRDLGAREDAHRYYETAIDTLDRLLAAPPPGAPADAPRGWKAELARLHHEFGILHQAGNAFGKALYHFEEGRDIREALCACAPHGDPACDACLTRADIPLRAELGRSHGYLGDIHINQGRHEEGDRAYKRSHAIRKGLSDRFADDPAVAAEARRPLKFQLARSYNNLAWIARYNGDPTAARPIKRRLAASEELVDELEAARARGARDGDGLEDGVARMLAEALDDRAAGERRLGEFLAEDGRLNEGLTHLDGAEAHYARLVALKPGRLKSYLGLARAQADRADFELELGRLDKARGARDAARATLGKLGDLAADKVYQGDVAKVHAVSGRLLLREGRPAEALAEFEAAREVLAEQVLAGGDDRGAFEDHSDLGQAMAGLAAAQGRMGSPDQARSWLRSARVRQEKALAMAPNLPLIRHRLDDHLAALRKLEVDGPAGP
ncbi:MAG: serine/threonine-protein kinase, partial [Isosphaeraceae bacterium]